MSTWDILDLSPLLAGGQLDPPPSLLHRIDGNALLYKGKVNSLAGESESMKTWLALLSTVELICTGQNVTYLDFEDSPNGIVTRLLALGVPPGRIADCFHYVRPAEPFDDIARSTLGKVLDRFPSELTIIDGITEAMTLCGLDISKNPDAAKFSTEVLRPIAETGAGVLNLDHLPKDADYRTRAAIGAVHKLNMINGASYVLDLTEPFGRGRTGKATVYVTKDRPGFVREHATGARVAGVLTLTSEGEFVRALLDLPAKQTADWRPTKLMERVSAVLSANPKGLSKAQVETSVKGRAQHIRAALEFLVSDGYARSEQRGRAIVFTSVKAYLEQS